MYAFHFLISYAGYEPKYIRMKNSNMQEANTSSLHTYHKCDRALRGSPPGRRSRLLPRNADVERPRRLREDALREERAQRRGQARHERVLPKEANEK